jgi:mannosyl-oligosaccharide glucosidase
MTRRWRARYVARLRTLAFPPCSLRQAATLAERGAALRARLEASHWNADAKQYNDYIVNRNTSRVEFVKHSGYVALFPLLLQLIAPDSPRLGHVLDMLKADLWSRWGVLSLAKSDKLFGSKENYWRGNIWININFLACAALHRYGHDPLLAGQHQARAAEMYAELRKNLIDNIFGQYQRTGTWAGQPARPCGVRFQINARALATGYVWEQYAAKTGEGKRSHPFTGWTALIVLIMAEAF